MIIQLFLSVVLASVAIVVALQRTSTNLVRLAVLGVIALGVYFVWAPEQANALAHPQTPDGAGESP